MRFLFVDKILHCENPDDIVGIKHVTHTDAFLERDDAGRYYLQDAIVGETLGQLAAWYVMRSFEFTLRPVAGIVDEVFIQGHAYIGDCIELHAHIDSLDSDSVTYHAQARVNGRAIFTIARALGPLVPMQEFSDPTQVALEFSMIHHPSEITSDSFLSSDSIAFSNNTPLTILPTCYDKVTAHQIFESISASKSVSLSAPYFHDHFARQPVFPMSLLLQCHTHLAHYFVKSMLGEENAKQYSLTRFYKVKMKNFIRPGDIAQTELTVQKIPVTAFVTNLDRVITLVCSTQVNDKRLCVAYLDFEKQEEVAS